MKIYIKKLIAIILIIPILLNICVPSSYASDTRIFEDKVNIIAKSDLESGANCIEFKVKETGVYCVEVLPQFENYEWEYCVVSSDTHEQLRMALRHTGDSLDKNANTIENYEYYSETSPCAVLLAGKTYLLYVDLYSGLFTLDENGGANENFVAVKLTKMASTEGTYYEKGSNCNTEIDVDWNYYNYYTMSDGHSQDSNVKVVNGNNKVLKSSSTKGEKANLFESILTKFFVNKIGENFMKLIGVAAGEEITIDKILFNQYSKTRISFFREDYDNGLTTNPLLEDSGILPYKDEDGVEHEGILNTYFRFFTMIAVIAYIVILLYMGIRIVLSSTGKDMAKYKKLFVDWVTGVAILFLFPYVMKYCIRINNGIVDYIGGLKNAVSIEEAHIPAHQGGLATPYAALGENAYNAGDFMAVMKKEALDTGRLVYAICWFVMIKEVITFLFVYIKRMLIILFLIVIFPLVTIYYAIDKIGDGKSQAFSHWVKEFILNVFLQTFHAINYVVVMGVVFAISKERTNTNFILVIIGITYVANGDKILRGIFSHMKGGGGGTVKDIASGILKTTGALHVLKSSANAIKGGFSTLGNWNNQRKKASDALYAYRQKKFDDRQNAYALNSGELMGGSQGDGGNTPPPSGDEGTSTTNQHTQVEALVKTVVNQNVSEKALKEALDKLAGMDENDYKDALNGLSKKDKKEFNNLMEENKAINGLMDDNALEGLGDNFEVNARINANMSLIIKNKTSTSRNMGKLNNIYSKKVSEDDEQKIIGELKEKNFSQKVSDDYKIIAGTMRTNYDKINVKNRKDLDTANKEIITADNERKVAEEKVEDAKEEIKRAKTRYRQATRLQPVRGKRKSGKELSEIRKANIQLSDAQNRERKVIKGYKEATEKYSEKNSELEKARKKFASGLELAGERTAINGIDSSVNGYVNGAARALITSTARANPELKEEEKERYTEIAKARAIHDKSVTGDDVSAVDLWEAEHALRKAKELASTDVGITEILKADENNPSAVDEFIGSKELEIYAGTKVLEEASKMEVITPEMQEVVNEVIDVIKQEASEGEMSDLYKEILRKAGVNANNLNEDEIPILKDTTPKDEIQKNEAAERKEINKAMHAKPKHEKTVGELRAELFEEGLKFGKESLRVASSPFTATVGMFSAGAYMGAASDYSVTKALGAQQLGSSGAKKVRDGILNITSTAVDETANRVVGVVDTIKNGADENTSGNVVQRTVDVLIHGDDNDYKAKTIHELANSAKKRLTPEQEFLIKKKAAEQAGAKKAQGRISQLQNGMQNNRNNSNYRNNRNNNNNNNNNNV